MAARFTAADYTRMILSLRPSGLAWPEDPETGQVQVLAKAAPLYERSDARAQALIVDGFPQTSVELLPEWESALGLPDPCAGESPTLQQRQNQVVARFAGAGGQSAAYFVNFAAQLGYTISVVNYAPFRADRSRAGDALQGEEWAHVWAVQAPFHGVLAEFSADRSAAGEPLRAWGDTVLECEIAAHKPAHTLVLFQYS